ncbi:MAG TPA: cytochrome C biogenesis protein [Desulfobacteraceae bacterium]|nr:cytochrome C biogenesis protein [Desulfobacteraceae bacterium]
MEHLVPLTRFGDIGNGIIWILAFFAVLVGLSGIVNLFRPIRALQRPTGYLLVLLAVVFLAGFAWIGWFHHQIYVRLPLALPANLAQFLNSHLQMMNQGADFGLPLYDAAAPPRYVLPLWLENEKYYFWFMCYALLALPAHFRMQHPRLRAALHILLAVQVGILFGAANPFADPLPNFFGAVEPWFTGNLSPAQRFGLFMQLYPKMIFYYNAEYMWFHPPLLFLSYACITVTFVTSVFMLVRREQEVEKMGYDHARLGFFLLTLGMLLGYPWALKAWRPNWWWDPKICSSIMMWAIYSTYLHTRLYAHKPFMWYFSSFLGILCFLAMIFTFISSFFFPGEHTFV